MKNQRLETIATFLDKEDHLADIGCDHGYLAILAIEKGINHIQLIDNKQEPLNSAIQNLSTYHMYQNHRINLDFTLASGLDQINNNIDTITICGMGGHLIVDLLDANFEKVKKLKKMILQANTDLAFLRFYLSKHQILIKEEKIIKDNGKYYEVICCHYQKDGSKTLLTEDEIYFGPYLLSQRSTTFLEKWQGQLGTLEQIKKAHKIVDTELDRKINRIKKILFLDDNFH